LITYAIVEKCRREALFRLGNYTISIFCSQMQPLLLSLLFAMAPHNKPRCSFQRWRRQLVLSIDA